MWGWGIIKFIYKPGPTVPPGAYSKKFFSKFLNLYNRAKNIQKSIPIKILESYSQEKPEPYPRKNTQNLIPKKYLRLIPKKYPELIPRKIRETYPQEILKTYP